MFGLGRIALMLASMMVISSPIRAKTVALWLFDDPPGSRTTVDVSGNGYDLTLGPDAEIVPGGKYGNALDADATSENGLGAFRYHAEKALNPGDEDWTLECWAQADPDMIGDNRIWGLSGVNYIDLGREDKTGLFIASRFLPIDQVTGWDKPTGNLKADRNFHHLAFVYDSKAKELRHYYDGKLQFACAGTWKDVYTGEPPYADVVFPPHYPMLQIGMRDALQQWNHEEMHESNRNMKKFQGLIDEMRFSDEALYKEDFVPPESFKKPALIVRPERIELAGVQGKEASVEANLIVETGSDNAKLAVESAADWLALSPVRQQPSQQIKVKAALKGLKSGRHETILKVSATGLPESNIPVVLTVAEPDAIRNVGNRKQLFIDNRFIEQSDNVELHINPPQKLDFDELPRTHYPRNIFQMPNGVWRMYYAPNNLCYAESTDGLHWSKPVDVVYESEEEPGKMLPIGFSGTVFYDEHDVPEKRFKAFWEVNKGTLDADGYEVNPGKKKDENWRDQTGMYGFYSADGVHFKKAGRVWPFLTEQVSTGIYWDPKIKKYVIFERCANLTTKQLLTIQGNQFYYKPDFVTQGPDRNVGVIAPEEMEAPGYENLRSMFRLEVDDLLKPWPVPPDTERWTVYDTAADVPRVLSADKWDGFCDFYNHSCFRYPYAEDVYLSFPAVFHHLHPSRQPWFHEFADANGTLEATLAVSRDGIHWDRVDRKPYIPMGRNDERDRWRTMAGVGMVRVGNDLYQYYWWSPWLHDSLLLRPGMDPDPAWNATSGFGGGMGVVRQRLDGFLSADVDYKGGSLTTPPITFSGDRFLINHSCASNGSIFVEIQDLNGQPIPGYSLADCEEVFADDVAWEIRWRGSGDVSEMAGKPIKLHFRMRNAKLFAFQFTDD